VTEVKVEWQVRRRDAEEDVGTHVNLIYAAYKKSRVFLVLIFMKPTTAQ
jgi:hypothetical protein